MITLLVNSLLVIIGISIGIKFADIDLAPVLRLKHRSVWTHGPIIVWLLMYLTLPWWGYWLVVGFLPANAIHLLADMFPRNWKGGATIKLAPLKRELAPILSFAWLALGVYISLRAWMDVTGGLWGWSPIELF